MVYIGVISHWLTIDPNFQRDIQSNLFWIPKHPRDPLTFSEEDETQSS